MVKRTITLALAAACGLHFILLSAPDGASAHTPEREGLRGAAAKTRTTVVSGAPFIRRITDWQRSLNRKIAVLVRSQRDGMTAGTLVLLAGLAWLYGTVHALGPGHGKLVIGSCVVGGTYRVRDVLKAAGTFTLVHNGSAVAMYTVFALVFGMLRRRTTHDVTVIMQSASGILLAVLGTVLLVTLLWKKDADDHSVFDQLSRTSLPLATALAGLVPCPGTLAMLLFAGTLGVVWVGYLLAFSFAAGMFGTLSLIAVVLASGRNLAAGPFRSATAVRMLRITGAALLIVFGTYLALLP